MASRQQILKQAGQKGIERGIMPEPDSNIAEPGGTYMRLPWPMPDGEDQEWLMYDEPEGDRVAIGRLS